MCEVSRLGLRIYLTVLVLLWLEKLSTPALVPINEMDSPGGIMGTSFAALHVYYLCKFLVHTSVPYMCSGSADVNGIAGITQTT